MIKSLNDNNLLLIELSNNCYYSFINKNLIIDNIEIVFKEPVDENTLRNMVYRLRKKFNEDIIVTIKDLGYLIKV